MRNPFARRNGTVHVALAALPGPSAEPRAALDSDAFAERLGLPSTATEDQILAAVSDRLAARERPALPWTEAPPGTVLATAAEWQALQHQAADGRRAVLASRDWAILGAVTEGRLTPFQARSVAEMWAHDPIGAREVLTMRPLNTVPVAEIGHSVTPIGDPNLFISDDDLADQIIRHQGESPS